MPDKKRPSDPPPPSKPLSPEVTDPPDPADPALVQRQPTMPDAYGIRESPEPPVCGTCNDAMVAKVGIGGEHLGWVCKNCPRESPPSAG
jgi:hypothetical protein